MPSYRPARLTKAELHSLQELEQILDPDTFLLAVERREESFVLEAKAGDGSWRPPGEVFPDLPFETFLFRTREAALEAKGRLKTHLRGHAPLARAPIRIVPLDWSMEPEAEE